jgi:transcriptional regulator with XRE-family HTH domain
MTAGRGLAGLGGALRRLRVHRDLKQYQTAAAAGITKAMLSAYETGKRRPSLKTLGRLLEALDADLGDLHRALVTEHHGDALFGRRRAADDAYPPAAPEPALEVAEPPDVYRVLGTRNRLPAAEEVALAEMLSGFHNLLRYLHRHGPPPPHRE